MANSTGPIRDEIDRIDTSLTGGAAAREYTLSIPIDLALVTTEGDVVTDLNLGHAFELVGKPSFLVTEALVGASKTVTLVVDVGATEATGGLVVVASASAAKGTVVQAAAAFSAGNTGTASSVISVRAETVTAFDSGKGVLMLRVRSVA
jgi:hypothetical protein